MSWILRRLDNLGAAILGGGIGACTSQAKAFADAYLQRLGGRLDEARDTLERVRSGDMLPGASHREVLDASAEQAAHVAELNSAYQAIQGASDVWQPVEVLLNFNGAVAIRAFGDFTPAVPLDAGGLVWAGVGVILGLMMWEAIKLPGLLFVGGGTTNNKTKTKSKRRGRERDFTAPEGPPERKEPYL